MLFLDLALVLLFFACQIVTVVMVGNIFDHGAPVSVLLGIVVPFLVWNGLMSTIIFLHHTHPTLRWYAGLEAWKADRGAIAGTAHVRFAWPIGESVLWIMEHNAHHVAPGVPLYNLARMQRAMLAYENLLSWRFSIRGFIRICNRCKLYDYELDRWVTFQEVEC
jgi:omega-6 fatty acid desaturase (delta-12 desaturase)